MFPTLYSKSYKEMTPEVALFIVDLNKHKIHFLHTPISQTSSPPVFRILMKGLLTTSFLSQNLSITYV